MVWMVYFGAAIFIIIGIVVGRKMKGNRSIRGRRRRRKNMYRSTNLPQNLGLRKEIAYNETIQRLEASFQTHFYTHSEDKLELRLQQEHPYMSKLEYQWKLLELKRYFIMASLLKQVPMFSEQVDQLWHEMLMFTRSYADFCAEFMGAMVHHEPAVTRSDTPGARAWFDWVYCQLFEFTPYSSAIWGDFFRYPLSGDVQKLIVQGESPELVNQLFHARRTQEEPETAQVVTYLIEQLQRSANLNEKELSLGTSGSGTSNVALLMASAMVYHSIQDESTYEMHMDSLEQDIFPREKGASSSSGCSSSSSCYAGHSSDHDSHSSGDSDSSSGSSSDSSCSSSSCSSCGGGGD